MYAVVAILLMFAAVIVMVKNAGTDVTTMPISGSSTQDFSGIPCVGSRAIPRYIRQADPRGPSRRITRHAR